MISNDTNYYGLTQCYLGGIKSAFRYKPCLALVEHCLPTTAHLSFVARERLTIDIYNYLDKAFLLMPWYLIIPLWHIQKLFQLSAFLSCGYRFSHQSQVQREIFVQRWCQRCRPFEALIRIYRSFVMLLYFEHPLIDGST